MVKETFLILFKFVSKVKTLWNKECGQVQLTGTLLFSYQVPITYQK